MNHLKHLLFLSTICSIVLFASCSQDGYCVCYIFENGVQTRVDESESDNCESESYVIDEDNYSICQIHLDGNPDFNQ